MILRKDAGAGRAGAASLPTRRNLSAAPSAGEEATRQRAIRRARRSARGFRGRTRRAVLSPVAQPPGEVYGRGQKGRTQARSMWSERRYRATRRAVFSPYAEQPPRCSLRGFPSQEGRIRGDQAARRAVFSHMRDSRRAELTGRSLPSDGRWIQRDQPASDTEEAAAQAISF